MYEFSKNPSFSFEEIIRVAFRAYNCEINLEKENRLVYIINYLFDKYYEDDVNDILDKQIVPKIDYQYYQ